MSAHRALVSALAAAAVLGTACAKQESLGHSSVTVLGAGVVNNPANRSLRFDILKFGLSRFCQEMTRVGVPLKLADDQPVVGRFFAEGCQSQIMDDEERRALVVQYNGRGYAWSNVTGRIGFKSAGIVEFLPDFQLHEGAMYIYFRPRKISANSFETTLVESAVARGGMAVAGVDPDKLGRQVVDAQLERGFTVIRYGEDGSTDFAVGLVPLGQTPFQPFRIVQSDKQSLANERTEVHAGQQDFVGGFEITEDDQSLYLTMSLDGAPAVDVFLVPKPAGDQMIAGYVTHPGPAALVGHPLLGEPLFAGKVWKRYVRAPKGSYYLVIDNTAAVGPTSPATSPGDDRAAKVDYVVQLGESP